MRWSRLYEYNYCSGLSVPTAKVYSQHGPSNSTHISDSHVSVTQIIWPQVNGSGSILEKKSTDSNFQTRPDPSPGKRAQAGAWLATA